MAVPGSAAGPEPHPGPGEGFPGGAGLAAVYTALLAALPTEHLGGTGREQPPPAGSRAGSGCHQREQSRRLGTEGRVGPARGPSGRAQPPASPDTAGRATHGTAITKHNFYRKEKSEQAQERATKTNQVAKADQHLQISQLLMHVCVCINIFIQKNAYMPIKKTFHYP